MDLSCVIKTNEQEDEQGDEQDDEHDDWEVIDFTSSLEKSEPEANSVTPTKIICSECSLSFPPSSSYTQCLGECPRCYNVKGFELMFRRFWGEAVVKCGKGIRRREAEEIFQA